MASDVCSWGHLETQLQLRAVNVSRETAAQRSVMRALDSGREDVVADFGRNSLP